MKKVVLFIIILTFILRGITTAQNPYESIGKEMPKGKILTLTNGKYPEVIENDTLVRIGSVMFNTVTGEVVAFLEKDTLHAEYNLEPDVVSRWLSPDPLAEKFMQWSPYVYGNNNPIRFIDPDGREPQDNIVYILALANSNNEVVADAQKHLREYLNEAGLKDTQIKVLTGREASSFDITKIDATDAVAVIGGNKKETADFILNNLDKGYLSEKFKGELKNYVSESSAENPELSDSGNKTWGYTIATTTEMANSDDKSANRSALSVFGVKTPGEMVALTVIHGMGHNSGIYHPSIYDMGFMMDGSLLSTAIYSRKGNVKELIKDTTKNNPATIEMIKTRFRNIKTP